MSVLVMVYGQSGTGKSTSLRNFSRDEVAIVNVSGKPLPFRNDLKTYAALVGVVPAFWHKSQKVS